MSNRKETITLQLDAGTTGALRGLEDLLQECSPREFVQALFGGELAAVHSVAKQAIEQVSGV